MVSCVFPSMTLLQLQQKKNKGHEPMQTKRTGEERRAGVKEASPEAPAEGEGGAKKTAVESHCRREWGNVLTRLGEGDLPP